jgi:hypothetical protein
MRADYSIYLLVTGRMTALAWCRCDQCLFPRAIPIWAESIPKKSYCDRLRGESCWELLCTLGGAAGSVRGVTTLGGNGTSGMLLV